MTRARIPLSAFRVPKGELALTLLSHGRKSVTVILAVADIEPWLTACEGGMGIEIGDRTSLSTHVQIRELLRQTLGGGSADSDACTAAGLWLALNHPFGAQTVKRQVSNSLRETDRAHITLASDVRHMWSVAISERLVDPGSAMAAFPLGTNGCLELGKPTHSQICQ